MIKKLVLSTIVGAVILYAWGMVSWMALPFHCNTMNGFKSEFDVEFALGNHTDGAGVYVLPHAGRDASKEEKEASYKRMENGPYAFVVYQPNGVDGMGTMIAKGVMTQILAALLVTILILMSGITGYLRKVGFCVLFGLGAGIVCLLPEWNWFAYPAGFLLPTFIDLIVSWFLAGLAMAKLTN